MKFLWTYQLVPLHQGSRHKQRKGPSSTATPFNTKLMILELFRMFINAVFMFSFQIFKDGIFIMDFVFHYYFRVLFCAKERARNRKNKCLFLEGGREKKLIVKCQGKTLCEHHPRRNCKMPQA